MVDALGDSTYDVEIITRKNGSSGSPTAIKIGGSQTSEIADMIEKSAAPLRIKKGSGDTIIIRYR